VLRSLGFKLTLSNKLLHTPKQLPENAVDLFKSNSVTTIGISPFAQHIYKVYPLEKMEIVISKLDALGYQLLIFGGGNEEKTIAENWASKFINVKNIIGKFTLAEELAIISHVDVMLSMDSSGMHMASLMGIRVVSVWGATHPYAGFLGYGHLYNDCIQFDKNNRPSSIYGNKPYSDEDPTGMENIEPNRIVEYIIEITNGKRTDHHPTC
ncbi:MAG: heptosyltransferase, partial [Pedobacter sp.]